jgi:2-dehydro-3-deoxyphosphogluconate aldolase/(4S)-4-hydroxy-2-oxoglutarate aldolase
MARFDRLTVYQTMLAGGLVPLFYSPDLEVSKRVVAALASGGCRVLEFTNRGDFAHEVFGALVRHCATAHPDMILGVGTVEDPATAALYLQLGANFVVAPSLNAEVARACNRRKVAYMPGCGTVTEIGQAEELGCEVVKLFPAETLGGPDFVKAVLAPRPWTRLMPSGGVSPDETNLHGWFSAGVACVGMGSKLIRADWLKAEDFAAIEALTCEVLKTISRIRTA